MQSLVRDIAKDENLCNSERESSKGICFIGKKKSFADWVAEYIHCPDGQFVSQTGEYLRRSKYAGLYTIGQGAKLPGVSRPFFVFDKDLNTNKVFVCHDTDTRLWESNLVAQNLNWIVNLPNLVVSYFDIYTNLVAAWSNFEV